MVHRLFSLYLKQQMKFIVFICKQNFATNEDHPTSLKEQDCLSNVYCRDACTSLNEIDCV